jgi:hypothetical protein
MLLPPHVNSDWGGIGSPICPLSPTLTHMGGEEGEEMPTPVEWVLHALQRKQRTKKLKLKFVSIQINSRQFLNPILHTAWLNNHALTLKRNTAKYYFSEKATFLHTFLKICCKSWKILVKLKDFLISML